MRTHRSRWLFGAAVLCAGAALLDRAAMKAADPVPDDGLKTLIEQDARNAQSAIDTVNALMNGGKQRQVAEKRAAAAIQADALMIAAFAQSRIGGKDPDSDRQMATLRDAALRVVQAGGKKQFGAASAGLATLDPNIKPDPKANVQPVNLAKLTDTEGIMYQFKKAAVGGLGIEDRIHDIADPAKNLQSNPAEANAIARRALAVADFIDSLAPAGGFNAKKPKNVWNASNKDMRTAANELLAVGNGRNPAWKPAFAKLERSCVACHQVFK